MKLIDILREINVPKPADAYPLSDPIKWTEGNLLVYKYNFSNRQGDDMSIETNFVPGKDEMYVIFYESKNAAQRNDDLKYGTKTGSGDMLKVLATVVEAVKRTANDLGGMQNVREILVQSDDPKRLNVYAHYAGTLFPDFKAEKVGSWIEMKNKKYNPEDKQLKEIGYSGKSYYGFPYTKGRDNKYSTNYYFDTGQNKYRIIIFKTENDKGGWDVEVSFGLDVGQYTVDFEKEVNDPKSVYRVMATVVTAVKEDLEGMKARKQRADRIEFNPTKQEITDRSGLKVADPNDQRRANLYMTYIKKEFPDSQIKSTANKSKIWVDL